MNKKPKHLNDGDSWMLAEEIPDIDFQFSQIWLSSFVNDLEKTIGTNYSKILSVYKGYNLKFYYGEKDAERISKTILDLIVNRRFGEKINRNIKKTANTLHNKSKKIDSKYLLSLNNRQMSKFYMELDRVHTEAYTWGWLSNAVDMFYPHFTEYLKSLLRNKLNTEEKVNSALMSLSTYSKKSFVQEEHESLLKLASYKINYPDNKEGFEKLAQPHLKKYFFLKHLWIGKDGVSTIKDIFKEVQNIIDASIDPDKALQQEKINALNSRRENTDWSKRLKLSKKEQRLFKTYAEFAYTKMFRRNAQIYWSYKMDSFFEELARRFKVSVMEARFMLPNEVTYALEKGMNNSFKNELKERVKYCVYYAEKGIDVVYIREDAQKIEKTIKSELSSDVKEIKGQVACTGFVTGKVKIVNIPEDMYKVDEGDILVSIATNPDILPAMKKAAAFVTEQGGITSHAAIVAREMKKPCVIGTKIATKVFKDGDLVEVDANKGVVKILKNAEK